MGDQNPGGGGHGPVYVDVYGTGRRLGMDKAGHKHRRGLEHPDNRPGGAHGFEGPHPDGPFWLRGLKGLLPLWMAFWGGFFFGHGIVLVITVICTVVGVVFSMTVDPARVNESVVAVYAVGGIVGTIMLLFLTWSVVAVWRCAPNADSLRWIWAARLVVSAYALIWAGAAWKFFA